MSYPQQQPPPPFGNYAGPPGMPPSYPPQQQQSLVHNGGMQRFGHVPPPHGPPRPGLLFPFSPVEPASKRSFSFLGGMPPNNMYFQQPSGPQNQPPSMFYQHPVSRRIASWKFQLAHLRKRPCQLFRALHQYLLLRRRHTGQMDFQ